MKVVVFNLGCKVNQYESDVLIKRLIEQGFEVSEKLEFADYYILNTCAVTSEAEKKSRQCIARVKKQNPDAKILVCGCASQNNPTQFEKDGVIYVSGTAKKELTTLLEPCLNNSVELPQKYEEIGFARSLRTRSYIKVQDGCNNFCSYCLIPFVRGRSRSRSIENIVKEIESLPPNTKEIVLTAINLSAYGKDIGLELSDLIVALQTFDIRIRLGSFETNVITDKLLAELKNLKRFCPHFHLSLQSGDDNVLKRMNRHYTSAEFFENVEKIRRVFPNAAITTDVIVGFPQETEQEFTNCVAFIKKVGFADLHIFSYSKRDGTVASKMTQVPKNVIEDRARRLSEAKTQLKAEYDKKFINQPLEVLFEDSEDGYFVGYSENYIKIFATNAINNSVKRIIPTKLFKDGLI